MMFTGQAPSLLSVSQPSGSSTADPNFSFVPFVGNFSYTCGQSGDGMMVVYIEGGSSMIRRLFFVLCLVALLALSSFAQARRTVTNSDLERYRQQRVAAEQELRTDYSRLGFASPEERARQNMVSEQQLIELSQRLKQERLERERIELEREQMMLMMFPPVAPGFNDTVQPGDQFLPTTFGSGRGRFGRGFRGIRQQQGYFAGGQFWPQGPRTTLRPLLATPHVGPHH